MRVKFETVLVHMTIYNTEEGWFVSCDQGLRIHSGPYPSLRGAVSVLQKTMDDSVTAHERQAEPAVEEASRD